MRKIILLFVMWVCAVFFQAAELPGGLDKAGNLLVAWELSGDFRNEPQQVYVALGDTDYTFNWLPPPSPDGLDDRLAIRHRESDGRYNYYTLQSKRIQRNAPFDKGWDLVVSTQDKGNCKITLTSVYGALPENAELKLLDSDGKVIADWSAVKSAAIVTVSPGVYRLKAELQFFEATVTTQVLPGWNLLSTPFPETKVADVEGRPLLTDIPVYEVSTHGVFERLGSWSGVPAGKGFWIYWDGPDGAEVTMTGSCRPGSASVLAEGMPGKWNFVGLQGAYDGNKKALAPPTGKVPKGTCIWETQLSRYIPAESGTTPSFGKGYLLR